MKQFSPVVIMAISRMRNTITSTTQQPTLEKGGREGGERKGDIQRERESCERTQRMGGDVSRQQRGYMPSI